MSTYQKVLDNAIENGDMEMITKIEEATVGTDKIDWDDAFMKACECRNVDLCEYIFKNLLNGSNIDVMEYYNTAVKNDDAQFIEYLLDNAAQKHDPKQILCSIITGCKKKSLCEFIIKKYQIIEFDTGLLVACQTNNLEITQWMVESGATNFYNALRYAVDYKSSIEIIDSLLTKYTKKDDEWLRLFKLTLRRNVDVEIVKRFLPVSSDDIVREIHNHIHDINFKIFKFILQELEKFKIVLDVDKLLTNLFYNAPHRLTQYNKELLAYLLINCTNPKALEEHCDNTGYHWQVDSKFITRLIKYGVTSDRLPDFSITDKRLKLLQKKRDMLSKELCNTIPVSKNVEVKEYIKMIVDYLYNNPWNRFMEQIYLFN